MAILCGRNAFEALSLELQFSSKTMSCMKLLVSPTENVISISVHSKPILHAGWRQRWYEHRSRQSSCFPCCKLLPEPRLRPVPVVPTVNNVAFNGRPDLSTEAPALASKWLLWRLSSPICGTKYPDQSLQPGVASAKEIPLLAPAAMRPLLVSTLMTFALAIESGLVSLLQCF